MCFTSDIQGNVTPAGWHVQSTSGGEEQRENDNGRARRRWASIEVRGRPKTPKSFKLISLLLLTSAFFVYLTIHN